MSGEKVDLFDKTRSDYPQPKCSICGRYAGRDDHGQWKFACVDPVGDEGWEHR